MSVIRRSIFGLGSRTIGVGGEMAEIEVFDLKCRFDEVEQCLISCQRDFWSRYLFGHLLTLGICEPIIRIKSW